MSDIDDSTGLRNIYLKIAGALYVAKYLDGMPNKQTRSIAVSEKNSKDYMENIDKVPRIGAADKQFITIFFDGMTYRI